MKKELLKQCRFYHGEAHCPDAVLNKTHGFLFWRAERMWVDADGKCDDASVKFAVNCELTDEQLWLNGTPTTITDVPFALRCFIFELYCQNTDIAPEVLAKSFVKLMQEYVSKSA